MIEKVNRRDVQLVSVHGGHSGQFCNHAKDSLENIIKAYAERGFVWAGITEHMPPIHDGFLFPDEIEAGLTAARLYDRFGQYIETGRQLQKKYASSIDILVGFETETYSGYAEIIPHLINEFQPDYIVGSLHHVDDMSFDFSPDLRDAAL